MVIKRWIELLSSACITIITGAVALGGEVDVARYPSGKSPTSGIQEAVDALPPGGGVVTIPKGQYALRQQIMLGSGVTLQGAGPETILHKQSYAETRLAAIAKKGSRSVHVVSARGFAAGDQVTIRDADATGWNVVQAIVADVRGNELLLDRPMPRTCSDAKRGLVVICFPTIACDSASKIVLKDFVIREDNQRDLGVHEPLARNDKRTMWAFVLPFPLKPVGLTPR